MNIDIKKPCQQQIQARCPWKYESSRWKCLLPVIVIFTVGIRLFADFLKRTSGFMLSCPHFWWRCDRTLYGDK